MILANWVTYVMGGISSYYGIRWFYKKNRNNFISYYRVIQTCTLLVTMNSLITILCCFGSSFVFDGKDISGYVIKQGLTFMIYYIMQYVIVEIYMRYLDEMHIVQNNIRRD